MSLLKNIQHKTIHLLRWSEQYTKTDMVYLTSGGFLSLISQVSALIGALLLAVMVSHFVPKVSYGEYKYILSIIALLSAFSLNGIGLAVLQSAAQGFNGSLKVGFWANLRWSFLIFAGALGMALYYFWAGNYTLGGGILIGGTFAPFLASASLFGAFLAGKKDFWHQTIFSIFDNLLPILLMVVTVMLTSNPLVLVAVYFVSNTLAALYFYRRTLHLYHAEAQKSNDTSMLSYGKHLSAMGVLSSISDNIDQILLFQFVGVTELAIYNFAKAIPDQMRTPIKNLDNMLQARFVNRTPQEIQRGMRNKVMWYFSFLLLVVVAYYFAAPFIFNFLFPQYLESIGYSQLYILWILAFAIDPAISYLSSRKNIKAQYGISLIYSVSNIGLLFFGVMYGILGVIIAKLASRCIVACSYYYYYRKVITSELTNPNA